MKAIVCVGIPCSGKSTWARQYCKETGAVEVNRDEWRLKLFDLEYLEQYKYKWGFEQQVTQECESLIRDCARFGKDIVVSDTNLNQGRRENLVNFLEVLGYEVELKDFEIEFFDALKRNEKRIGDKVPRQVIYDMYRRFREYKGYGPVVQDPNLPAAYIFDIDGTLATAFGEDGKLMRGFFEWKSVGVDRPIPDVVKMAKLLHSTWHRIILMSGRDECCRAETEAWLQENGIPYHELHMRPEGSMEKDRYVKEALYREHVLPRYYVHGVFDDRPQVALLWQDLGLTLFKVGDPIWEF